MAAFSVPTEVPDLAGPQFPTNPAVLWFWPLLGLVPFLRLLAFLTAANWHQLALSPSSGTEEFWN